MRRTALPIALALLLALPGAAAAEEPAPRPLDTLLSEMGSRKDETRERAALEVGRHGAAAKRAAPALVRMLKDRHERARIAAAISLQRVAPTEFAGIEVLARAVRTREREYLSDAVQALLSYPADAPGVADALFEVLSVEDACPKAIERLMSLGPALVPRVHALLARDDPRELFFAWPVIERLGAEMFPALLRLLDDSKHHSASWDVGHRLGSRFLSKYPPPVEEAMNVLRSSRSSAEAVSNAIESLARVGEVAVPALVGLVDWCGSAEERVRAFRALERFGEAGRPAVRCLRSWSSALDPRVREAATSALWKIDPGSADAPARPRNTPRPWAAARKAQGRSKGIYREKEVEAAVGRALDWLAAHQEPSGLWAGAETRTRCAQRVCGGPGLSYFDEGVTALALLAFLGAGESHLSERYGDTVRRGLEALIARQKDFGPIGRRDGEGPWTLNHALATLALCDATAMTGAPELFNIAENAARFVSQCQNPYLGWRYGEKPKDCDTVVTGWMAFALHLAEAAGVDGGFAAEGKEGARTWFDKVTEPEEGRAGYTSRRDGPALYEGSRPLARERTEGLTALAVVGRLISGADSADGLVAKGRELCVKAPPVYDPHAGTVDFHFWHFASLALHPRAADAKQAKAWKNWHAAAVDALLYSQKVDAKEHGCGSWEPEDPWCWSGGRAYATAINALTLETPWRYPGEWFTGKR